MICDKCKKDFSKNITQVNIVVDDANNLPRQSYNLCNNCLTNTLNFIATQCYMPQYTICPKCNNEDTIILDTHYVNDNFIFEISCEKCGHIWHAEND